MERRSARLALLAFFVLQVVLTLHHEPWRDEAETWLTARDCSPGELLRLMPYGGNPSLWYWLLVPFAKAGLPFATQQWLHLVLAVLAAGVLLLSSPFPLAIRVLAAFSYYLSFEYAVVSRHYVLTVLFLFLLADLRSRRDEHPFRHHLLIGLLANVNAHSFLFASVLLGFETFRQLRARAARPWRPFLVSGVAWGLALWQLVPPPDGQFPPGFFVTWNTRILMDLWPGAFFFHFGTVWTAAAVLLVAVSLVALRRQPEVLALLVCGWVALLYVFVFKHVSGIRHLGLAFLWFLFCLWIANGNDAPAWTLTGKTFDPAARCALWLFSASLAVSAVSAERFWEVEVRYAYSGGKEMAGFLKKSGLAARPIAAHPAPHAASVLAQLPKRTFYYPAIDEEGSHMKWDRAYAEGLRVPVDEAIRRVRRHYPNQDEVLLLLNQPLPNPSSMGYRLLHVTPGPIFVADDERFFLYEAVRG